MFGGNDKQRACVDAESGIGAGFFLFYSALSSRQKYCHKGLYFVSERGIIHKVAVMKKRRDALCKMSLLHE